MANVSGITIDTNSITSLISNIQQQESRLRDAIQVLADTGARKMEAWAKQNAIWTDRTGNARQGIIGEAVWLDNTKIAVVLSHSVDYGIWLELAMERKYAILETAIDAHKDELLEAYRRLVG